MPPGSRPRPRPPLDVRGSRPRLTGVDLPALAGIDAPTALPSLSASGLDRGRWPTVKQCPSWRGRCPHPRVSGGKVVARGPKPRAPRGATALRLAASCWPRRQSALGACCRRMNARLGTPQASTAMAPTLARLISPRLNHGTADVRHRLADSAPHDRDRRVQRVPRRAKALGEAWVQTPAGPPQERSSASAVPWKVPRGPEAKNSLRGIVSAVSSGRSRPRGSRADFMSMCRGKTDVSAPHTYGGSVAMVRAVAERAELGSAASQPRGAPMPSSSRRRLNGVRSPGRLRFGGGAAHVNRA